MKKTYASALIPAFIAFATVINAGRIPKTQLPRDIRITNNGSSDYVIVRAEESEFAIKSACSNLSKAVKKQTGTEIKVVTDKTEKYAAGAKIPCEILVGKTNRNVGCDHAKVLRADDFSVCEHEKTVVLSAGSNEGYAKAAQYITDNLIADGELEIPENFLYVYRADYEIETLTLLGADISEYDIVYSAEFAKEKAQDFAGALSEKSGISFEAADKGDGKQIIFGNHGELSKTEYAVTLENGNIYISSPTKAGLEKAYGEFASEIFDKEEKYVTIDNIDIKGKLEKTDTYSKYIRTATPLANTYHKLTEEKELTVAYFGGSVTVGHAASDRAKYSWRARTTAWIADNFPEAKVTEVNSAIGATGSHLGAFRTEKDIISYAPDLVFIEYSVNDTYNGESEASASENYEAIVRSIRKAYPDCDIVSVYVTDSGKASAGGDFAIKNAHEKISKAYGIPAVDVGKALIEKYGLKGSSSPDWKKYFTDSVHMNDEGFYEYALVLSEFLANELLFATPSQPQAHILPEKVTEGCERELQYIFPTKDMLENAQGFEFKETGFMSETPGAVYNGYLTTSDPDNSLTFTFTGTELSLFMTTYTSGVVEYEVDGKRWKVERRSMNNPFPIVKNLSYGEHTITMKFKFNDSKTANIGAFLVR